MLAKEILSLQHPIVKHLVQLRQNRAYREEQQSVLITGINVVQELAQVSSFRRVLLEEGYVAPFSFQSDETLFVTRQILKKITALENPEPLLVEIDRPSPSSLFLKKRVLILDRISDPGNLGTLLRTALAFGWDGVFALDGCVDFFNDKVLRASKGAIFQLAFDQGNEAALQKLLDSQSWNLLSATANGQDVKQLDSGTLSSQPLMLAIGNESCGLSDFVSHRFTPFALPMKGKTDSINAAMAGSIFLYLLQA